MGEPFKFMVELRRTPELLFLFFLPVLIFESAFNMSIRKLVDNGWTITLLSVVGLLISTGLIAVVLHFVFPLVGINMPIIIALLFGAIISATDPVAVLSLLKEIGVPKRLSMIFEGESLFNDGTAVALFTVLLGIAVSGFDGISTIAKGSWLFVEMVGLGIVFGLLMAAAFSYAVRSVRANPFVSATLLLVSAHIVFISSEMLHTHGLFGIDLNISSIIATTVAALFLGNYARHTLTQSSEEYLTKVTEHFAFMVNSLVFIPEVLDSVMRRYEQYREQNAHKLDLLLTKYTAELSPYLATLAKRGLDASGGRALEYLENKGLVDKDVEERIRHLYGEYAREP